MEDFDVLQQTKIRSDFEKNVDVRVRHRLEEVREELVRQKTAHRTAQKGRIQYLLRAESRIINQGVVTGYDQRQRLAEITSEINKLKEEDLPAIEELIAAYEGEQNG
jgi:hypothetical protein